MQPASVFVLVVSRRTLMGARPRAQHNCMLFPLSWGEDPDFSGPSLILSPHVSCGLSSCWTRNIFPFATSESMQPASAFVLVVSHHTLMGARPRAQHNKNKRRRPTYVAC